MKPEQLMEIALTLSPQTTRVQAARNLAKMVNDRIATDMHRSERTVEAYCTGQRKIPMEYSVAVMNYLSEYEQELFNEMSAKVQADASQAAGLGMRASEIEEALQKMQKTIDKMQAATQSTGMLLAIRAMCEDCAGGPASNPENTCWWKNCPLRPYSDMPLAKNPKSL